MLVNWTTHRHVVVEVWWQSTKFYIFAMILFKIVSQVEFLVRVLRGHRKGKLLKKSSNLNRQPLKGGGTWYFCFKHFHQIHSWLSWTLSTVISEETFLQTKVDISPFWFWLRKIVSSIWGSSNCARFTLMHLQVWTVLAFWPLIQDQNVPGDALQLMNIQSFLWPERDLWGFRGLGIQWWGFCLRQLQVYLEKFHWAIGVHFSKKHRKNCECCHHHSLFKGHNVNVDIVILNCQKCNQYLKCQVSGHKSLGLLFEGFL